MPRCFSWPPILASVVLGLMLLGPEASSQEVELVPLDSNQTKEIAKGYRAEALKLKTVTNDKGEMIGRIDDFIFGHEKSRYFRCFGGGGIHRPGRSSRRRTLSRSQARRSLWFHRAAGR